MTVEGWGTRTGYGLGRVKQVTDWGTCPSATSTTAQCPKRKASANATITCARESGCESKCECECECVCECECECKCECE